ncbi:MAG: SHOCT domain-containing protein [Solirubrobacterales bacterium]
MTAPSRLLAAVLGCLLAAAVLFPPIAAADLGHDEQRGVDIAEFVRSGQRCSQLSAADFELIGEYAMGRYLEDTAAHKAMNEHMVAVMGEEGERRMHIALGHRYSGCGGGPAWSWMGPMAGMMYGTGYGASGYGPGMMGGRGSEAGGFGPAMMYGYRGSGNDEDGFDGPSAAAMIGMMAVLSGAVAAAALWLGRRRDGARPDSPLETLRRRYASGELDEEQYQERRRLVEGR